MLVVPHRKKLVLSTPRIDEVLAAIPHAKAATIDGEEVVVVPHGVDETTVLSNMGFEGAPAPILHYYDWPGRVTPMDHQLHTSAFLSIRRRALCLNSPGTGKSLSALWAADYLLSVGVIKRVLIIAPLSTLKVVWGKEIVHHLCHRRFELVTGAREKRIKTVKESTAEFLVINHDGFTTHPELLRHCDLVIYDEATALKTPSANRYKAFAKFMSAHNPRLWMLTGTPIAQSPVDAWALAKLVNSPTVPHTFSAFKDMVMRKVTTFKWLPRDEAADICRQVLQPSIRFTLDECIDLPETVYITRECELTAEQIEAYKELQDHAMIMRDNITAANAAVLVAKLLQVCCGVVYDRQGGVVAFDDKHRVDSLVELLEEIGDKVIVFVPLRSAQRRLEEVLSAKGYDVAVVNGDTSQNDRNKIFYDFQNTDRIQVLLAHPKVAAHGLTLTRASSIVWYAPIYSLEMYEQANARIRRLTTEGKTVVYHMAATGFEKSLYKRLLGKQKLLMDFLDMVQGVNEN